MIFKRLLLIFILSTLLFSCKDKDTSFVQIKDSELRIYHSIRDYREANNQTGPFVHQYLMVEEAQLYSYKMVEGLVPISTQGLDEHWDRLDEKYTFYNKSGLVIKTDSDDLALIFSEILQIPGADSILLSDVSQCGVGVESDLAGTNYITILLAKADS